MEGMTWVSVESKDAKCLLPGYITVVVVSACAKSVHNRGSTLSDSSPPFCQVTIILQEDSCHNKLSLTVSIFSLSPSLMKSLLSLSLSLSVSPCLSLSCCFSLVLSVSPHTKVCAAFKTISGVNIYCGLFESLWHCFNAACITSTALK